MWRALALRLLLFSPFPVQHLMVFKAFIPGFPFQPLFDKFFLALIPLSRILIQQPFLAGLVHLEDLLD